MQLLLDLNFLPLTSCFSSGRTILGVFPAADTMGKTVSRDPGLTSAQVQGKGGEQLQIIQGTSVVLLIVTKAHQCAPRLVLKHE